MLIKGECVFHFVSNTVQARGAGILYHSISKRISAHHNCRFIQPINSYYNTKASFHFVENCAPKDTRYLNNIFQESSIQSYSRKNYSYSHQLTINSSAKCNIEDYTAIHNEICNYMDDWKIEFYIQLHRKTNVFHTRIREESVYNRSTYTFQSVIV